ncbi:DUF2490 domain-containing protein [Haliscomenobacter hydrossis]|uniref:DUF2490 domain-containing protein n=1 Tax=Haliscomenobacter hydrossis (strain ATCC 27775 / DSM 1100 / LMG 10767 / O) TaxID=760192 RepID=F4L6E1_HALH1|nr:DUF2490 domain-containing protein [Haliscomenobacter hydrossis]AEE48823.1 Protein of unknown function DUF2490 [Haliscomenobacter hydrossis DSM 1100]
MSPRLFLLIFMLNLLFASSSFSQNTRIKDYNKIGWWATFATLKLSDKWGIHAEYQWRREAFVDRWQQSLLRIGANHQLAPNVLLRAGYAWIETFNYGEYPINGFGRDFTEHRMFQMLTLSNKISALEVSHRFMLEQRWIGRYSAPEVLREDDYFFVNRLRYMFRIQLPLKGSTLEDKEFYAGAYDEILIGFGRNVNENIFDQNRLGLLLGYRFNSSLRIEGGFFNQILQLPREIQLQGTANARNVFQHNSGLILNSYLNFDLSKDK